MITVTLGIILVVLKSQILHITATDCITVSDVYESSLKSASSWNSKCVVCFPSFHRKYKTALTPRRYTRRRERKW